jgi:hypothetical protein
MEEKKTPDQIATEEMVKEAITEAYFKGLGEIHLIITNQTQALPSPLPPYNYKGVKHQLQSVPALADLLRKHGSQEKTIVYFNDENINAVLDHTVQDRPFDTALYSFEESPQASDWSRVFGKNQGQKDFLKARAVGEIYCIETLMLAAQKITGNFKVISESTYIDSNNMGIVYKIEDQAGKTLDEGQLMLPEKITVTMPLLKESPELYDVEIDLELTKPVDARPPYFVLTCPRWPIFWRLAVDNAVEDLRDRLPGYLIIAGEGFNTN